MLWRLSPSMARMMVIRALATITSFATFAVAAADFLEEQKVARLKLRKKLAHPFRGMVDEDLLAIGDRHLKA